jgi:hypothetical protein
VFGAWGLLPVALPCALFVAARLGALVFPTVSGADRALAGSALSAALVLATVRLLGAFGALTGGAVLGVLVVVAVALALLAPRRPVLRFVAFRELATGSTAPLLAAAAVAVAVAVVAALWLPVWQWDALGYHLPYVNFALIARGFGGVPDDMPYVSTYPHNVETLTVALRAMLPDDRLVDLVQIPCALLGGLATAGIARRVGAPRSAAVGAGAAWLVVPAVFLQMPTDYVDIASVAFLLTAIYFILSAARARESSALSTRRKALLLGGLSLGIYLGTKPNAPLSASVVAVLLVVVGVRSRDWGALAVALALVAVGGETFVVNALRYGNPVWPVRVQIGPIFLPGRESMQHLLESGALAPHLHGSLASRVVRSWTSLTSPPVFDMRIGGLGPLVLAAMPAALVTLIRRRDGLAGGALLATVIAPDPSVARYVLAFPAVLLALAAPRAAALPRRLRPWFGLLAGGLAVAQIAYAWPGLTGDGPSLQAYAHMTDAQRALAVGANGPPAPFADARKRVAAGETFAFDQSLDLPYLAWESDLRYRAVWIPGSLASAGAAEDFLESENVRVVAAAADSPVGQWLAQRPERFLKLFQCRSAPCSVFARR